MSNGLTMTKKCMKLENLDKGWTKVSVPRADDADDRRGAGTVISS